MTLTVGQGTGSRRIQPFMVSSALVGHKSTASGQRDAQKGVAFLKLQNCYYDHILNAIVRRDGSALESISGTLGKPIMMGEHVVDAPGQFIPFTATPLTLFEGPAFRYFSGSGWVTANYDSSLSFNSFRPGSIVMGPGRDLFVAAGALARWRGPGSDIVPIGIPAPTEAPTITEITSGPITWTEGATYVYTYRNSSTDEESDWSPRSASTGAGENRQVRLTLPTDSSLPPGVDEKRIYRTYDGGVPPFLVATVGVNITDYTDTTPDDNLTDPIADEGDHATPPTDVFILAKFAQRMWAVDGANSRVLRHSEAYTNNDADLAYWPEDYKFTFNEPITGLLPIPGKLLVFHARNISYLGGTSLDTFVPNTWRPGIGTLFHTTLCTDGTRVFGLAEDGWADYTASDHHVSTSIDYELEPLLQTQFNADFHAFACYHKARRQFICGIGARALAGEVWEDADTGTIETWEDVDTSATEIWEDDTGVIPAATTRSKIWSWSPSAPLEDADSKWGEYTFHYAVDGNATNRFPTFIYYPSPSSVTNTPQQDRAYLGIVQNGVGKVASILRVDKTVDDTTNFSSLLVTAPLFPGIPGNHKWVSHISFDTSYVDPLGASCSLKYLLDFDEPHKNDYTAELITISVDDDSEAKVLPQGSCKFLTLVIEDTSSTANKILLSNFALTYRERKRREMR